MQDLDELIKKYKVQSDTLLRVIHHPKSTEDEKVRTTVARRFVESFINDLKNLKQLLKNIGK